MKQLLQPASYRYFFLTAFLAMIQVIAYAQDSATTTTSTSTSTTTERTWFAEPWVWVVGGIILLILIIALTRGGGSGRTDKVTVTKTRTVE